MANNIHALRSRLRSIRSTQKITKAMRLVAISKLQQIKGRYLSNQPYSETLADVIRQVLAQADDDSHPLMNKKGADDKPLAIVFTSDLGLAGGYNQNIFKEIENKYSHYELLWLGTKGFTRFKEREYKLQNAVIESDSMDYMTLSKYGKELLNRYRKGEITSITILYTQYVNATTYEVESQQLLPVTIEDKPVSYKEILFEPNAQSLLDQLIPRYMFSELYRTYMSAKTSEYSSRRVAMENATDNAQELIDKLQLEYNKVRQAAITQEITEIVSGSIGG